MYEYSVVQLCANQFFVLKSNSTKPVEVLNMGAPTMMSSPFIDMAVEEPYEVEFLK